MNNGKICVSVSASNAVEIIENIKRAEEFADVIEVRFDGVGKEEVSYLLEHLPATDKTYLFTYRPREQGGNLDLSLGERLEFWEKVFHRHKTGFMIDIECDPPLLASIDPDHIERIVSQHYFTAGSENHQIGWEPISSLSSGPIKIAVMAEDVVDSIGLWNLLDKAKVLNRKFIPIAMGEAGKWTRILGLAHGAMLTYAALDVGGETAPGQVTARELDELYRVKELDQNTKVFGVIGDPISQSLSTYIHNPAFASTGLNSVLLPFLVKDLDGFFQRMVRKETREVELNFGGFAVTMPHKQTILQHLDSVDITAQKIGAVNTVKIEGEKLIGYNTDAHGFIAPLKQEFGDLAGAKVAICGAGGAARACVYALKQEKADVTLFARHREKAEIFGKEFKIRTGTIDQANVTGFDVVVNSTPLGMKGSLENNSVFSAEQLIGVDLVYDLVTKPTDTPLVCEARKAGARTISGINMLVEQGAMQFELWTGTKAPLSIMKEAVLTKIRQMQL